MRPFTRAGETITAVFEPQEVDLLRELSDDLVGYLGTREQRTGDPAMLRLLPDAYRDDPESASDFRRFTEDGLIERKIANARVMLESLPRGRAGHEDVNGDRDADGDPAVAVEIDLRAAGAWMRSLADHRLILAARLGIVDERTSLRRADKQLVALYDWLAFVQDSLVRALDAPA
ncbi:DUF2017 family protein [Naasia lichenicola]|uniref:DUF2017 family protein n=1 Tax=Naasia lichenicola TaxID=2565933 RepID=A0A4S4FTQ8_9MICO|nr:DUF2017 family protein [Naasia lichenicola]THG33145.1 DUF2017 family protein [Naasia lichenicola]